MERFSFDLVLKITERCNLACPYCYYFNHDYDATLRPATIREDVVRALPAFIQRSRESMNLSRVNIVFHGGEPLLLKKKRFVEVCEQLMSVQDETFEVALSVQTNGTLIDEDWIDIFARYNIKTGISIDGPQEAHDKARPDHRGRGSFANTVRGLNMVESARQAGRLTRAGALAVVDIEQDLGELLDFLIYELGVTSPNLNYPRGGYDEPSAIKWGTATERIRPLVHSWLEKFVYPTPYFVRGLTDIMMALHSHDGMQASSRRYAMQHFIATIASDGSLMVDDNLISLGGKFQNLDLNIQNHTLKDLVLSPVFKEMTTAIDTLPHKCQSCVWMKSCRSGALYNRYSRADGFARESVLCEVIQMIHEEVASFLVQKRVVTLEELGDRLENAPVCSARELVDSLLETTDA